MGCLSLSTARFPRRSVGILSSVIATRAALRDNMLAAARGVSMVGRRSQCAPRGHAEGAGGQSFAEATSWLGTPDAGRGGNLDASNYPNLSAALLRPRRALRFQKVAAVNKRFLIVATFLAVAAGLSRQGSGLALHPSLGLQTS